MNDWLFNRSEPKNPLKILLVHFIEHRRRNRFSRLSIQGGDPLITAHNNREENERKNRKARTGGRRTQQEDKLKEGTKREEE